MTGMGFDGLVVNHGGLNEITDQLYKMVKDIDDRMNRLEGDLAPLQSEWSGNAQTAYITAKQKWDTAIAEMMQLLNDTGPPSATRTRSTTRPTCAAPTRSRSAEHPAARLRRHRGGPAPCAGPSVRVPRLVPSRLRSRRRPPWSPSEQLGRSR